MNPLNQFQTAQSRHTDICNQEIRPDFFTHPQSFETVARDTRDFHISLLPVDQRLQQLTASLFIVRYNHFSFYLPHILVPSHNA